MSGERCLVSDPSYVVTSCLVPEIDISREKVMSLWASLVLSISEESCQDPKQFETHLRHDFVLTEKRLKLLKQLNLIKLRN